MDYMRTYYAMKNRMGGAKLTVRDKLLMHRMHMCPGNVYHKIPRREIIFKKYVNLNFGDYTRKHKAYVMYWRSHPNEYAQMINKGN